MTCARMSLLLESSVYSSVQEACDRCKSDLIVLGRKKNNLCILQAFWRNQTVNFSSAACISHTVWFILFQYYKGCNSTENLDFPYQFRAHTNKAPITLQP